MPSSLAIQLVDVPLPETGEVGAKQISRPARVSTLGRVEYGLVFAGLLGIGGPHLAIAPAVNKLLADWVCGEKVTPVLVRACSAVTWRDPVI